MDADLDSLLTEVFCTADDLLPTKAGNARRMVTDAEVVTLAVAQVLLGYHDSDRRFLAAAQRRLVICSRRSRPRMRSTSAELGWKRASSG